MHMPELSITRHLGSTGELVGAGAEEVAALHVAQRPAAAVVVWHAVEEWQLVDVEEEGLIRSTVLADIVIVPSLAPLIRRRIRQTEASADS